MKAQILFFSSILMISLATLSCKKDKCEEFYKEDCIVTQDYTPVCGCNGKTYANSSYADCAGVEYTAGKCTGS